MSSSPTTKAPTPKPTTASPTLDPNRPLDWTGWFTLALIIIGGFVLVRNIAPPDLVFLGIDAMLCITTIITSTEAYAGFSASSTTEIGILMVCSEGLTATGGLGYFVSKLLGKPRTVPRALAVFLFPVLVVGSFVNDTPTFLMFVPIYQSWAAKLDGLGDPRQFYVPISFACLLSGTVTLIGTSTNLVIQTAAAKAYPKLTIPLFGVASCGLPTCFAGYGWMVLTGEYLLPSKQKALRAKQRGQSNTRCARFTRKVSEFFSRICAKCSMTTAETGNGNSKSKFDGTGFKLSSLILSASIDQGSPVVGKSIQHAGLRSLHDLFVVSVTRGSEVIHAVDPKFTLLAGDVIAFTGSPEHFLEICRTQLLSPVIDEDAPSEIGTDSGASKLLEGHMVSVIVRNGSKLIGKTPKEVGFRSAYDASIIGIERSGKDIRGIPFGQLPLKVGDVLVLLVGEKFELGDDNDDLKLMTTEEQIVSGKDFIIGARVLPRGRLLIAGGLAGKTIQNAGLRGITGVYLIGISKPKSQAPTSDDGTSIRTFNPEEKSSSGEIIRNPPPSTKLEEGDICWFSGGLEAIKQVRLIPGLELLSEAQAGKLKARSEQRGLVEVAISSKSNFIGSTIREIRFRTRFGAVVIAIRRSGEDAGVFRHVSEIPLAIGDVLVLDASPSFVENFGKDPNFLVVNAVPKSVPPQFAKFYISFLAFVAMFVVFGVSNSTIDLTTLGLLCAGIMVTFRVLTPAQARAAVRWDVLVIISAATGLSSAMTDTRLANKIGQGFVNLAVATGTGAGGILAALYISTAVITLLVAKNATAQLMFTIGTAATNIYGLDPYKMFYILMLAASADYSIPYGYQTNIMAVGLGGYTVGEFMTYGIPLQLFLCPISIVSVIYQDEMWIMSLICVVFMVIALGIVCWPGPEKVIETPEQIKASEEYEPTKANEEQFEPTKAKEEQTEPPKVKEEQLAHEDNEGALTTV